MATYTYLLLSLGFLLPLAVIFLLRRDLAGLGLKVGVIGGAAGLISEAFYFHDYWRPPSLLGTAHISIEDFLFGFAITALSAVIFPFITKSQFSASQTRQRQKAYGIFFVAGLLGMIIFTLLLGYNSILISSLIFILLTVIILRSRRDLIKPALVSAGAIIALSLAVYLPLFNWLSPDFWNSYWLLADSRWGITILGNIPLSEMLWYTAWALFASVSYPFVRGCKLIK